MGATGLEPVTSTMSTWHSSQLSYAPGTSPPPGPGVVSPGRPAAAPRSHRIPCLNHSDTPGRTRTPNPLIRSQVLYPIELRALRGTKPARQSMAAVGAAALGLPQQCPRQDSNLYVLSNTGPSNQPVYQFQHVGSLRGARRKPRRWPRVSSKDRQCSGRDSNPHGVNPHRILNPARLPIPPPERLPTLSAGSPTMEPRGVEPLTS